MAAHILTQKIIKELLHYNPETGNFTWIDAYHKKRVGKKAGCVDAAGYWVIRINRYNYKAHRLAWLYVHGNMSDKCIDHINGERTDNRIDNLREATNKQNNQNRKKEKINSNTGYLGVGYHKRDKKYHASIRTDEGRKYLGYFDNPEDAHNAYIQAKRKHHEYCTI